MSDSSVSRRSFLKGSAALGALGVASMTFGSAVNSGAKPHVVVIGAGAFGGWTALNLLRQGARVTLLDAWGAGNSRASSGGETRVIRGIYGKTELYVQWAARSLRLWQENEKRWGRRLYNKTGALWMIRGDGEYVTASLPFMDQEGLRYERLGAEEAKKRFPIINPEGIKWAMLEKDAGFLLARQACQAVVDGFVSEGGEYRICSASPRSISHQKLEGLDLFGGTVLSADLYVFACGPWLGKLFPDVIGKKILPTRQEVFFFGTPAGDLRFTDQQFPVWVDFGERLIYGIPGNERRGFKLADDTHGPPFDPTSGDRTISAEGVRAARDFLSLRFPDLKDAPLVETRVCQYENSPDSHFIIDRHPEAGNVWIVGGGSGHGFKHGPALGEYAAGLVLGKQDPESLFLLNRFHKTL